MMAERVLVYDQSGYYIRDPEGAIDYASGITIETRWPQGYAVCSFKVRRSDVFADWVIRESYGVKIFDEATLIYEGRIETMGRSIGGADEYITVECTGWYVVLAERLIRKRWIDVKAVPYLEWPVTLETSNIQGSWVTNKRDNIIQVFAGSGDVGRTEHIDCYREQYDLPAGTVRRVKGSYAGRTGEGIIFRLWNHTAGGGGAPPPYYSVKLNGNEYVNWFRSRTPVNGTFDVLFTLTPTRRFEIEWSVMVSDLYDQNDYVHISNLRVEANYETGHRTSTPTYTQGQLIEDVLLLAAQQGQQISVDMDQVGDPGQILDPFAVEEPAYAGAVADQIAAYGDSSLNTWGLSVWGGSDTSDGLPRAVFERRSVSDYEYEVGLNDLTADRFAYAKISDKLRNTVIVGYEDKKGIARYRSAADNAALANAASIADEYPRGEYIKIGQADTTRADMVGKRFITYRSNRLTRASIVRKGWIKTKDGRSVPTGQVRAGQRVKLLETGEILFIRQTNYDAESKTVTISPDEPEDNLSMLFLQRERGLGALK